MTQEQAVKIAEWLGVVETENGLLTYKDDFMQGDKDDAFEPSTWRNVSCWLYSPEGQSAVMDKLDSQGYPYSWSATDRNFSIMPKHMYDDEEFEGNAPTRQEALIDAVLEMLKGGE